MERWVEDEERGVCVKIKTEEGLTCLRCKILMCVIIGKRMCVCVYAEHTKELMFQLYRVQNSTLLLHQPMAGKFGRHKYFSSWNCIWLIAVFLFPMKIELLHSVYTTAKHWSQKCKETSRFCFLNCCFGGLLWLSTYDRTYTVLERTENLILDRLLIRRFFTELFDFMHLSEATWKSL